MPRLKRHIWMLCLKSIWYKSIKNINFVASKDSGYCMALKAMNMTYSLSTSWIIFPSQKLICSIGSYKSSSKIEEIYVSSSITKLMKLAVNINLLTLTKTSSVIPRGCLIDRFTVWSDIVVGHSTSFLYTAKDIKLITLPKLHNVCSK